MKLLLNAMPIFGITIDTGKIQMFTNEEDAIAFFQSPKPELVTAPKSMPIKKNKNDAYNSELIMPWEISKKDITHPRKELK
ncbi:MAG: hypothetical protein COB02_00250 [Candidatus Cloacimonadota bacterium]|nr:MAG: hypothetical protein COB02_00250 [Candidatus Cloacimonadota bacterium]